MMRAIHILVLCTNSCASALDIFIQDPVLLLDCTSQSRGGLDKTTAKSHVPEVPVRNTRVTDATEEPGQNIAESHIAEEPVDPKEFYNAARNGNLSFINDALPRLNASGLDLNWRNPDNPGYTALHIATIKGHSSIVGALLDAGADPNVQDYYGDTPVIIAAGYGRTGVLELMLAHEADSNKVGNYGTSPLMAASYTGHVEAARMLILAGAHVDYSRPEYGGHTALHTAARYNHPDVVSLLLQNGADKNKQDSDGDTAADVARRQGNDSVAHLIDNY